MAQNQENGYQKIAKVRHMTQQYFNSFSLIIITLSSLLTPNTSLTSEKKNNLQKAQSPYLLQFSKSSIYWQLWNDDTFAYAKKQDKLVFLSIGNSNCHLCQTVNRDCFDKENITPLLNQHFVSMMNLCQNGQP